MPRFYLTTAIYYPNAVPHLGTAYEILGTDAVARWRRLRGDEVFFLSGNDDHAQKVALRAAEKGQSPEAYCDGMAAAYDEAWRALGVSYDEYIRTASDRHRDTVRWFFERVRERDRDRKEPLVYKGAYEGLYCLGCEAYLREKDLADGRCPSHPDRVPQALKEENWFFRLSDFAGRLDRWFGENPEWLRPESKRNEMRALLREGLQDVSISRPRRAVGWGIPFPGDEEAQVVYVWFDALINYVSGARLRPDGTPRPDEPGRGPGFWPADLHVVGKDIVRFHALLWPAMLWAADLPLPRSVFVHGFVQTGGAKMSKSQGAVVSPVEVAREYGTDALRYFLLREVAWGADGEFSLERLEERYASDLANTLGNLLHRTLTMIEKYCGGQIPDATADFFEKYRTAAITKVTVLDTVTYKFDNLQLSDGIGEVIRLTRFLNEQIDKIAPWVLARDPAARPTLDQFLYGLADYLKVVAILLSPILPKKSLEMWLQLGLNEDELTQIRIGSDLEGLPNWEDLEEKNPGIRFRAVEGITIAGRRVRKGQPLFPRREVK